MKQTWISCSLTELALDTRYQNKLNTVGLLKTVHECLWKEIGLKLMPRALAHLRSCGKNI